MEAIKLPGFVPLKYVNLAQGQPLTLLGLHSPHPFPDHSAIRTYLDI